MPPDPSTNARTNGARAQAARSAMGLQIFEILATPLATATIFGGFCKFTCQTLYILDCHGNTKRKKRLVIMWFIRAPNVAGDNLR